MVIEELIYVIFDEFVVPSTNSEHVDKDKLVPKIDYLGLKENDKIRGRPPIEWRYASSHP